MRSIVHKVVEDSDILLLVLDARALPPDPYAGIVRSIRESGKRYLFVVNKVDAITKEAQDAISLDPVVFISAKEGWYTTQLLKRIMMLARGQEAVVGVIGMPNVGKSSIINALTGTHKASTSARSGHTRGRQLIRLSEKVMLLDSPGIVSGEGEEVLVTSGAIDVEHLDPMDAAYMLLERHASAIAKHYGIVEGTPDEMILAVAQSKNLRKKGGLDDVRAATMIVREVQRGMIRI